MANKAPNNKKLVKVLTTQINKLQTELVEQSKREGKDSNISVSVKKNQARFERIKQKAVADKALGKFYLEISIVAKSTDVFVPLSIASGKKTAGFMYQIEGGAPGSIVTAEVKVTGSDVSQVTVGTLLFAKVPAGKMAVFEIRTTIKGAFGKVYEIVFSRLNYKLQLSEVRYQQYLKEIRSKRVIFS